jgi:hypothetical protein
MATVLPRMVVLVAAAAAIAPLALAGAARADEPSVRDGGSADSAGSAPKPPKEAPKEAYRPTRRGGFMVGIDLGAGVASIVGFPNDLKKIGFQSGYTVTGVRPAALGELWYGSALTDFINFGLGVTGSALFATGDDTARSIGGLFRVEAFPLFPLGGRLRDLGVRFDAGIAMASVADPTGMLLVDSSAASMIGGGIFWEGLRAWKTAHGPMLVGNYVWSDSARRPAIFLGWRSVLYTSPKHIVP